MRTTDRIGFKLIIKEPDTAERTIVVCPRYDGLKMKWQRESGKVYHTLDFEGNLEFWGVDFVTLLNCPLLTVFELVVFLKGRGEVGRSEFRKTDCEWNLNDGWCKVDISTYDKYSKINDHKDDEYNLVSLPIDKKSLSLYVYPQNQVYLQEDKTITMCGYNGSAQASVDATHDHDKLNTMGFDDYLISGAVKMNMVISGYGTLDAQGMFSKTFAEFSNSQVSINGYRCISVASGTNYQLFFGYHQGSATIYQFYKQLPFKFILALYGGGQATYIEQPNSTRYDSLYGLTSFDFGPSYAGTVSSRIWVTYAGTGTLRKNVGQPILSDDITAEFNNNYRSRVYNLVTASFIKQHVAVSNRTSSEDKGYGRVENTNTFYNTPDDNQKWLPVKKESWFIGYSVWVGDAYVDMSVWEQYKDYIEVSDFYLFTDAVRAVIQKIDPTIVFEDSDSHFLADATNPVSGNPQGPLYISQKSNVLNLGYDYPAWQAPVKWSQIETFLKNALGCYWDLYEDANGVTHLRIEHKSFYDNGGTYSPQGNPSATIDLLHNRFDVATRQPQAFHTNRWKWDVDGNGLYSSACRYEYGWMDTQSAIFDGETVEVPEEYRLFTDDKTEERKVDWFSSDIDFLTAVQAECSSDGFVVVMEDYTNPGWIVSGHENYSGQNYQLSFEYLQPLYLVYGIYAEKVQIGDGNTAYDTGSHARMRTSEVSFNLLEGEWVEPSDVLITEVGEGVIDTLTYDMSSEKWTATVRYNNE